MQFCREIVNMPVALITALVANILMLLTSIVLVTIEPLETHKTKCNSTMKATVTYKINMILWLCWNVIEPIVKAT